jgi:hypothetical protein
MACMDLSCETKVQVQQPNLLSPHDGVVESTTSGH